MPSPINLQSNYPVLAEQEAAWPAQLAEAAATFAQSSLRLPAFGGLTDNRAQAAAWLSTPAERTFIATGGHHGTFACLLGAGVAGKTIAVEALTYPWFLRQAEIVGCRIVPVALDDECMVPAALDEACRRERIDMLYTMPSMHNPTGATATLARRQQIVQVARRHDVLILEDAAYGFLVADEPPRYVALASERSFYVESLSKRVAPGLRTAFLVAPAEHAAQTELALRLIASGSGTLLASLGCTMAADGRLAAVIAAKRVEGERRRRLGSEILAGLRVQSTPNSWHLWVTLADGDARSDEDIETECEARGVLVTGARWFTAQGAAVPRAIRLGLGGETEWDRVADGLKVVAEILRRSRNSD